MGITDKVSKLADNLQEGAKTTSISLFNWSLKIASGLVYGLTFALVGQTMMGFGTFAFIFMSTVVTGLIVRLLINWSVGQVLLFDLFSVLVALLLRMYILVAP